MQLFITLVSIVAPIAASSHWSYADPDAWKDTYPTCGGNMQSPIALSSDKAIPLAQCIQLQYSGFDDNMGLVTLTNNGHSVAVTLNSNGGQSPPMIFAGPIFAPYQFSGMHFHWGRTNDEGSEHQLNGRAYAMEAHMVFTNPNYGSDALNYRDGAVVLATLYDVSDKPNPYIQKIVDNLPALINASTSVTVDNFPSLGSFLPPEHQWKQLLTYLGSLTTPPCSQSVQFIVYETCATVTRDQVDAFGKILDGEGHRLAYNYRPLQALNSRNQFRQI